MKIIETKNMYIAHYDSRIINVMVNISHCPKKDFRTYDAIAYKDTIYVRATAKFKKFLKDNKLSIEEIDKTIEDIFLFEMSCNS